MTHRLRRYPDANPRVAADMLRPRYVHGHARHSAVIDHADLDSPVLSDTPEEQSVRHHGARGVMSALEFPKPADKKAE
jgi:hypothetical protein